MNAFGRFSRSPSRVSDIVSNATYQDPFAGCDDHLINSENGSRNVYVAFFCLICVTALLTNGTVLYIICIRRLWRDVSVVMIGNLAVSDIFVCIGVLVPEISRWVGYWKDGTYSSLHLCRIHVVAETLFPTATIFSLVVMSFERCRISRSRVPVRSRLPHRVSACYFTLAAVWAAALASSLPVVKICLAYDEKFYYADDWGRFMTIFVLCRFVFIYILPLLLIAFFYSAMSIALRNSIRQTSQASVHLRTNSAGKRARARRRRLGVMVFLLVAVFAIGWLPNYLYRFLFYQSSPDLFCTSFVLVHLKNFRVIFFCFLSLLNPCIVYVLGANFRRYLNDVIKCKEKGIRGYQTRRTTLSCNIGSKIMEDVDLVHQNGDVQV